MEKLVNNQKVFVGDGVELPVIEKGTYMLDANGETAFIKAMPQDTSKLDE